MKKILTILLLVVSIYTVSGQTNNASKDTEIIKILEKHFSKLGSLSLINNAIQESTAQRKFEIQDNYLLIYYSDPNDFVTGKSINDTILLQLNELGKVSLKKGKGSNGEDGIGIVWVPEKNKINSLEESNGSKSKIDQKQLAATSGTLEGFPKLP